METQHPMPVVAMQAQPPASADAHFMHQTSKHLFSKWYLSTKMQSGACVKNLSLGAVPERGGWRPEQA